VTLRYLSVDGHGGYPGNLQAEVTYRLSDANQLDIEYKATTDKPSIINLTNHSYFNLQGHQHAISNGVLDHRLQLLASNFVPTDEVGIPLGGVQSVDKTPLDFSTATRIGDRILDHHVQLINGKGYDHNWIADSPAGELSRVAVVHEPVTGRTMEVETTQPGLQFYSGNNLSDRPGKSDVRYGYRGSLCLETQHYPDAPNNADFPEAVIRPGLPWLERARFTFSVTH